jgi:hypothetical protein
MFPTGSSILAEERASDSTEVFFKNFRKGSSVRGMLVNNKQSVICAVAKKILYRKKDRMSCVMPEVKICL